MLNEHCTHIRVFNRRNREGLNLLFGLIAAIAFLMSQGTLLGQEAQWIGSPEFPPDRVQLGEIFFRKTINLTDVEQARITIIADDAYELAINGRLVGKGETIQNLDQYDVTQYLSRGRNVISVVVENRNGPTSAMAAQVQIKQVNSDWKNFSTDGSWKTSVDKAPNWQSNAFVDSRWKNSRMFGKLGETAPWDAETTTAETKSSKQRFETLPGFSVEKVIDQEATGSLIAMAFNEFGHIVASQEGGPLLLIYDSDKDGRHDKTRVYCEEINNIQGILPLNGDVYVTGEGPQGSGLYKLVDEDRNGSLDVSTKILGFKGTPGEHGAHQLTLGPDGMIYVAVGNHVQVENPIDPDSPYQHYYEGDLPQPRYEDPGGHARGIKAPGGTIVRVDLTGEKVELVAGGIRNAYDLAFHPTGALLLHDSDMEADIGTTWYRPTTLFDICAGAELGWRSGWAQWPEYYLDRIPSMLETGRGSPTGAIFYDHYAYPSKFQRTLFLADWSEGRIMSVDLKPSGAGMTGKADVFVKGQPLNVTDLDVGPDGMLYFSTGGRGTDGGIYRVRWNGEIPKEMQNLGTGIAKAIRHPQMSSAWARQDVAVLKKELGESWGETVAGVAFSSDNPARYRVRALELMQLLGPVPSPELLIELSKSPNELVRGKAVQLMGLQENNAECIERLTELLSDSDRMVQRFTCESMVRLKGTCAPEELVPLLSSDDRTLAFAARRLLESMPSVDWQNKLLASRNPRLINQAGLALMRSEPSNQHAKQIVNSVVKAMDGFISDRDFLDTLRVLQVTLHRSQLKEDEIPQLRERIEGEFPAGEPLINRELVRLAVFMQAESICDRALTYLESSAPMAERVHVAMHLRFLKHNWTPTERLTLMKFLEDATRQEGGSSYPLYVMNVTADLGSSMSLDEARMFLKEGERWPNAALAGLRIFPAKLTAEDIESLTSVDRAIDRSGLEADYYKRLKTGITAVLSQSQDPKGMAYLREAWRRSPDRRSNIALGLSAQPDGENWDYLVRSLGLLDPFAVPDVMGQLCKVATAPEDPDVIRNVILMGLKNVRDGESPAPSLKLLKHWTTKDFAVDDASVEKQFEAWQGWFAATYPDRQPAALPDDSNAGKWTMELLNEYLDGPKGKAGVKEAGMLVYNKAKCADCHRFAGKGTTIGPDLTSLSKRFTRTEVLESILYPAHVISDQYAAQRVLTTHGESYVGMVSKGRNGTLRIVKADLTEVIVPEEDVDEVAASKTSMMPSGLIENLSAEEIRDLMCYIGFVATQEVAKKPEVRR